MRWAIALAVLGFGCREPEIVELRLVTEPGLRPERDFGTVVICISELGSGDCSVRSEFPASSIGAAADAFDPSVLVEGRSYELRFWADVPATTASACTSLGHAVGRSLPFEHRAPPYAITVQVGCANEFSPTHAQPLRPRLGHTIVPRHSGDVIVAAGAERLLYTMSAVSPIYESPVLDIERYDPATGRFEQILGMPNARRYAGGIELRDGSVVIAGGQNTAFTCASDFEIVWPPAARRSGSLAAPRCGPSLVRMSGGLLVTGSGWLDGMTLTGAERHGPNMNGVPVPFLGGDPRALSSAFAIGGGEYVLVVGGQQDAADPLLELVSNDGLAPFPIDARALPDGWTGPSSTYVPCAQGGGAVFLAGGTLGDDATDSLYCFADVRDGTVSPIGALAIARRSHEATYVTIDGVDHLLLAGGLGADDALVRELELVPVDACACATATASGDRPLTGALEVSGTAFLLHSLARLADGTALLYGGVSLDSDDQRVRSVASALLFYPDFARP
jgi:hypothetical protein